MNKSVVIAGLVALAYATGSAAGQQIDRPKASESVAPSPQRIGMGNLRYFDGNDCVGSNGNCLPDVVVKPKYFLEHARALSAFEEAVSSGATADYFKSDKWKYLFPSLNSRPEQLKILQSGIPIIRLPGKKNIVHYIATRMSADELRQKIAENKKRLPIAGIEVCIPIVIS